MNIALLIIIIYMAFIIAVAILSNKLQKKKDSAGFLLAGRSMPWYLVAVMVTGIAVGGASTVGVAEQAYTSGLSAGWYTIAWALASLAFGLFISNKVRKYNIATVTELITKLFGKKDGFVAIFAQILLMFGINATQIVAGGAILTTLLPNVFSITGGMCASALVYLLTSFLGGYLGASITNLINVIVIYAGLIVSVIYAYIHSGGAKMIQANLPAGGHWIAYFRASAQPSSLAGY